MRLGRIAIAALIGAPCDTDSNARPSVCVVVDNGSSEGPWRERYEQGRAHEPSPWGYGLARGEFNVRFSADRAEHRVTTFLRKSLRKLVGFDFIHIWRNRRLILSSDIVWAHTEREHLAVAALIRVVQGKKRRTKILGQTIWLYDEWSHMSRCKKRWIKGLLSQIDIETVNSSLALSARSALLGPQRIVQIPFGSSYERIKMPAAPDLDRPLYVSAGNDQDRDWPTLLQVAMKHPEWDFVIACEPRKFGNTRNLPANVRVQRFDNVLELKNLYVNATAVVVPLKPNLHVSGVTVALEAVRQGCSLVVDAVGGLEEYLPNEGIFLYKCGDSESLSDALDASRTYKSEPIGRDGIGRESHVFTKGLRSQDYAARHVLISRWLLGAPWDERISRFEALSDVLTSSTSPQVEDAAANNA